MAVRDSHVTFSNTVLATLDMTNNVFKPHGVHGVIGAAIDSVTEAIAGILAGVDLPQIACKFMQSFLRLLKIILFLLCLHISPSDLYTSPSDGATGSELSHSDNYPTFLRVVPSDAYQGTVIANMISQMYGWKRVIAFATSDNLGTDALLEFQTSSTSLGIEVVKGFSFPPGNTDFSDILNQAQPYDVRVFVFLITNVADASTLLVQGFDTGVFSAQTMFFFTTLLQVNDEES